VQYLRDCSIGEALATYNDMEDICGTGRPQTRASFYRAAKVLQTEYGVIFKSVRNKGYKPLPAGEAIAHVGVNSRTKIKAETIRWRDKFEAVPTTNLKTPKDVEAWLKECLKLNAYEDMQGGRLAVRVDAVIEAVKEDDRLSPENMRQMQLNALKRINGL
jgi:hypothetical protein